MAAAVEFPPIPPKYIPPKSTDRPHDIICHLTPTCDPAGGDFPFGTQLTQSPPNPTKVDTMSPKSISGSK